MAFLSLSHICLLPLPPPEVVSLAAAAGFDAVGLRLEPALPDEARYSMTGNSPMLRETRHLLAQTGLKLLDVEVFRLIAGESFARYRPVLEVCAELGGAQLLTTCGIVDGAEAADRLAEACDVAAEFGLDVNVEFMPWQPVDTLDAATALVRAAERPNAKLVIDTLHVHRSGMEAADLGRADPALMRYLQLCDAPPPPADPDIMLFEARYERLMPGEGVIPLADYLRALPCTLPVSVEVPMRQRLREIGPAAFASEAHARASTFLAAAGW